MSKKATRYIGKAALKARKTFLMVILFFNAKILSKFVSIQSQVDINKRKKNKLSKIFFINLCITF